MKYVKISFWTILFIVLFVLFTLNVYQSVDFRYFYGTDDVFKEIPLFVVIFFSMAGGFFLGVLVILGELMQRKKECRAKDAELSTLKKELDTHRNIAVKEFIDSESNGGNGAS
ncbi:MAG: LapA family protein [Acidobacteria bacterium]|nr:LapA family protein [Acidobacteriota bacterium]